MCLVCWWWILSLFLYVKSLCFTFILKEICQVCNSSLTGVCLLVLSWKRCSTVLIHTCTISMKSDILNFDSLDVTCHTPLILCPLRWDYLLLILISWLLWVLVSVFFSCLLCLGFNCLELWTYGFYYIWNICSHYFFKYVLCLNIHHLLLGLRVLLY